MKLIVGLGNPEDKYSGTRHNLGFDILDKFASKLGEDKFNLEDKFKAEVIKTTDLILVKPQTYMNKSGMAIKLIAEYFKVEPEDIVIIHDELDLPLGKIKVRLGGSAAGHHGVESVIDALNSDKFIRVRLGIGNLRTQSAEHKGQTISAEKFVLEPFMHGEKSKIKHMTKQALTALELVIKEGLEKAQNQFN